MAELRNPTADRWDFDKGFRECGLAHCFPRNISFADVDSETEINGHFLCIEGKRDGEVLHGGQLYAMRARVRDGRTCLIVYGDPPYDVRKLQLFEHDPLRGIRAANLHAFHAVCRAWATWADQQPRRHRQEPSFIDFLRSMS